MRLLIIGGSDAGISAALRAMQLAPDTETTMVVADHFPNFSICGIPFFLSGEVEKAEDLAHRTAAAIEAEGIRMLLGHRATRIDAAGKTVEVAARDGARRSLPYDKLVLGIGAASIRPPIPGLNLPGVFTLRWMDETLAIDAFIRDRATRRAAIVGGGYIGLEMAEALVRRGLSVTLVEAAPTILTSMDPDLGTRVQTEFERHGVDVRTGTVVKEITEIEGGLRLTGDDGLDVRADMALVVVGARPETALAAEAGAEIGVRGAIKVNRRMETNLPDVFAAGDCVETWHRVLQHNAYLPLGTTSHKQGRIAGENAAGGDASFSGSLGTQSVRLFELVAARTGLNDKDAHAGGLRPVSVDSEHWDHKVYYPGAKRMLIRITGDRDTGRLLGAQIIGGYGSEVSKRVDIFAVALHHGMSVEGLNALDLSYTPPLSSPWDPVQMAAQAWTATAQMPL